MLRIATWNVNSVRVRLAHIARFSQEYAPDVLCLQETKARDADFPSAALAEMGYSEQIFSGIPGYNGVAVLAKIPMSDANRPRLGRNDARHLSIEIPQYDLRLDNVYVPAGGNIPDPELNDKFAYKLDFMAQLTENMAAERPKRAILLGDINIAPGEYDVFPMQAVTVGERATEFAAKLFAADEYTDYLYFHGLAVQLAEALAEWCHARIRRELGYGDREPEGIRDVLAQRYQGSRYSFGYPACPNMQDQPKQMDLLEAQRIGMYMDESEQLYPEQSTTAIVAYHPAAKYFSA